MARWRLATFNMESLDLKPSGAGEFKRRVQALTPILHHLAADILCLQEVNAQHVPGRKKRAFTALERLIAGTGYETFHVATSVNPESGAPSDVHNLAILSRWPFVRTWQIYHDHVPPLRSPDLAFGSHATDDGLLRWDRPVLAATIAAPHKQPLHVYNLHLRAPRAVPPKGSYRASPGRDWAHGFFLAAMKRQGQALDVRLDIEERFDADAAARIIVCGDFNADSYETPVRLLSALPNEDGAMAERSRRLDALALRLAAAKRYSVIHDGKLLLLDHMLASASLVPDCVDFDIFNSGLQDEYISRAVAPESFHAPLVATFDDLSGC